MVVFTKPYYHKYSFMVPRLLYRPVFRMEPDGLLGNREHSLLMAYYNFLRPHSALRFGKTLSTPAIQAGLVQRRLSFRDVFTSQVAFFIFLDGACRTVRQIGSQV